MRSKVVSLRGSAANGPPLEKLLIWLSAKWLGRVKPIGVIVLEIPLHALGTQLAFIKWKLIPWLEPNHRVVVNFQLDSALLATKATVRIHNAIHFQTGVPTARWRIVLAIIVSNRPGSALALMPCDLM